MTTTTQDQPDEKAELPYQKILFKDYKDVDNIVFDLDTHGYNLDDYDTVNNHPRKDLKYQPRKDQTCIVIKTAKDSPIINASLDYNYGTSIPNLLNWTLNEEYKEGDQYFDFISVIMTDDGNFLRIIWYEYDVVNRKPEPLGEYTISTKHIEFYRVNAY